MRHISLLLIGTAAFAAAASARTPAPPPMPDGPPGIPGGAPGAGGPPGGMPAMPSMAETKYVTAVRIRDGSVVGPTGKSVATAVKSPSLIEGASVSSSQPAYNPIFIEGGKSAVTVKDSTIRLSGIGTNDFLGTGAGLLVRDNAAAVVSNVTIETNAPVSSALVAAEGATVRVYNSRLFANGGPLPADYKPRIGPGMMEPPAPLGLVGTARTVLAMSNSRTYFYDSVIEADGWGALSTDATGGDLYLEANDCTVKVRRAGYGTYADFGAHVVVNRSRIDSGGVMGIIAGKARTTFDKVSGRAASNIMMIHSVMAFDITETAEFTLADADVSAGGSALLVKSANAAITIDGGKVRSDTGTLLEVRKNDDANATKTNGKTVPGVMLTITNASLEGDVIDSDPDRETRVFIKRGSLSGALQNVAMTLGEGGKWMATGNSTVVLMDAASLAGIDAASGVIVTALGMPGSGTRSLPSGGTLKFGGM